MNATAPTTSLIEPFIESAAGLYTLPTVAIEVLELTRSSTANAAELKARIEQDPALTVKILRVVNSSMFGVPRQIGDLNHAVALLGAKPLQLLVLGMSLPSKLTDGIDAQVLQRYWQHAMIKSVGARQIAEILGDDCGDEAFIAGLLQDIGQLVLIQQLNDTYVHFLDGVHASNGDVLELEAITLGFNHVELSAGLLTKWGLPAALIDSVTASTCVEKIGALPGNAGTIAKSLYIAELIARLLTQGDSPAHLKSLLDVEMQYHSSLDYNTLHQLIQTLAARVKPIARALQIKFSTQEDYVNVLESAYARLSDAAEEAAVAIACPESADLAAMQEELSRAAETVRQRDDFLSDNSTPAVGESTSATNLNSESAVSSGQASPVLVAAAKPSAYVPLHVPVAKAIVACRQSRGPLSLAVLDLDDHEALITAFGLEEVTNLMKRLGEAIHHWVEGEVVCFPVSEVQLALVMEKFDRQDAVRWLRQLFSQTRDWLQEKSAEKGISATISIGMASLALPPNNFPPQALIDAAYRCVDGAHLQGGDVLKSIDI